MAMERTTRAVGLSLAIAACAALVCVLVISTSDLKSQTVLVAKAKAGKAKAQDQGSFVLNYLKSNKDVDGHSINRQMHRLTLRQIQKEAGDNTDNLNMMIKPLRRAAVGPDGLSDVGDLADISLLNQLTGQDTSDAVHADAVDLTHRARDDMLAFGPSSRIHDMAHVAAAIDQGVEYGQASAGAGADRFHALVGADARDVDNLGSNTDREVFQMVGAASKEPSRGDVHINTDQFHAVNMPVEAHALASSEEDSEAEMMADPRQDEIAADRAQRAKDDKGVWIEPGSNKGYDSYALDSLQGKNSA